MRTRSSCFALSLFVAEAAFGSAGSNTISFPDVGGLKHVFTDVKGKAIAHPIDFPMDGKGTKIYLKEVCRALGHDEIAAYKIQESNYYDVDSKQWIDVEDGPRVYESITCAVWVR
ncbi:MAG TPA: hypothetical protein VE954_20030 [Oligoflexus sp.]|uniref:hypothetical protein n=1 Tax=Oligoflexus sp. TaxID=1971216 RepID=UPI002D266403|nr:hypothetical protein [Oligoflexus sp.]HYX35391.1 hypothetical protein [Oligoflexus sp.]